MTEIEQTLQSVREVFVNYPKRYETATEELRKVENEIQDILHVIEFCSLDAIKMTEKYKELKALRVKRRELKDELELLGEVKSFLAHQKPSEKIINNTIGKIRSTLERQHNRTYTMRVRKDWQRLIK